MSARSRSASVGLDTSAADTPPELVLVWPQTRVLLQIARRRRIPRLDELRHPPGSLRVIEGDVEDPDLEGQHNRGKRQEDRRGQPDCTRDNDQRG